MIDQYPLGEGDHSKDYSRVFRKSGLQLKDLFVVMCLIEKERKCVG